MAVGIGKFLEMTKQGAREAGLRVNVLGELEVHLDGEPCDLPKSKKARALFAYLALTQRKHRRDRLCTLFWDVADDPRAALRWCLSRLRKVINQEGKVRLEASRDHVWLVMEDVSLDALLLSAAVRRGLKERSASELAQLAGTVRGPLLEGLSLPDFWELEAWLVAEREQARGHYQAVLEALSVHPEATPAQREACTRALALEEPSRSLLDLSEGQAPAGPFSSAPAAPVSQASPSQASPSLATAPGGGTVGRDREWQVLNALLEEVAEAGLSRTAWLLGEAGIGKSHLLHAVTKAAQEGGRVVLRGSAFETEVGRPYGPFIDALRTLDEEAPLLGLELDLGPLLPERLPAGGTLHRDRERLFGGVGEVLRRLCASRGPLLVCLDDVQWLDPASVGLLHACIRTARRLPILILLASRVGELRENAPAHDLLVGLRRSEDLTELRLPALSVEAIGALFQTRGPDEVSRLHEASGGNPLFAKELAKIQGETTGEVLRGSFSDLIEGRLRSLSEEALATVRLCAVLGHLATLPQLERIARLDLDVLVDALELLQRRGLLAPRAITTSSGAAETLYGFPHDALRQAVYEHLSPARRRVLHGRVAKALGALSDPDGRLSAELAQHAAAGGDLAAAAAACIQAGRRCLTLLAYEQAYAVATRGLTYAAMLPEPEATEARIRLLQVSHHANPPNDEQALRELRDLCERALRYGREEAARAGFSTISFLRHAEGDFDDAMRHLEEAERAIRRTPEASVRQRVIALAELARCIVFVEGDLPSAESYVEEAQVLADAHGVVCEVLPAVRGLLHLHHGRFEPARRDLVVAVELANQEGHRFAEFLSKERLMELALYRQQLDEAHRLAADLRTTAAQMTNGTENETAACFSAVVDYLRELEGAEERLEKAIEELAEADNKRILAICLSLSAAFDLRRGALPLARDRARRAQEAAEALRLPTELARATVVLYDAALAAGDMEELEAERATLATLAAGSMATWIRVEVEGRLSEAGA